MRDKALNNEANKANNLIDNRKERCLEISPLT